MILKLWNCEWTNRRTRIIILMPLQWQKVCDFAQIPKLPLSSLSRRMLGSSEYFNKDTCEQIFFCILIDWHDIKCTAIEAIHSANKRVTPVNFTLITLLFITADDPRRWLKVYFMSNRWKDINPANEGHPLFWQQTL